MTLIKEGSTISWTSQSGDIYLATGKTTNGQRFKIQSSSWSYINGINLYKGTKWLVRDGRKIKLSTTIN